MICPDCKGKKFYQPLIGPPVPCTLCGGTGEQQVTVNRPFNLTLKHKSYNSVFAGQWYMWERHHCPLRTWDKLTVRYDSCRLLIVDARSVDEDAGDEEKLKQTVSLYREDDPDRFDKLVEEFHQIPTRTFVPLFYGPQLQFTVDEPNRTDNPVVVWHAWSRISQRLIIGESSVFSHRRNKGPLDPGEIGNLFELASTKLSNRNLEWFAPTARKLT